MKAKFFGALLALGLAQSAQAQLLPNNGTVVIEGTVAAGGYIGAVTLDDINVTLLPLGLPGSPGYYQAGYSIQANFGGPLEGPDQIYTEIDNSMGPYGPWGCRYAYCTTSVGLFYAGPVTSPTLVNFDLTISSDLELFSSNGMPPPVPGTPPYELDLVLADGLSVIPLPAALPLFASGLGVMGLLGWRRKRKDVAAIGAA